MTRANASCHSAAHGPHMKRIDAGSTSRQYRPTANRVFLILEGSGTTDMGGQKFAWRRGDALVAPTWATTEHRFESDTLLFALSDEPLMRFRHYYRFEAA